MKKVAIIGGGPTRKHAPWKDQTFDIWVLNEAASKDKDHNCTGVFQMHQPGVYRGQNLTDPEHWNWLQKYHDGTKIWMQDKDSLVPNSEKYPLEEIQQALMSNVMHKGGKDREARPVKLYTFSGVYALALAIYLNYSDIEIYGIDMIHTEEYRYQRESFAFWVGVAAGRGIHVYIDGAESIFQRPLYGYETYTEFKENELSISERINLLENVLPRSGDLVTMQIVSDIQNAIGLKTEEIEKYKIAFLAPGARYPFDENGEPTDEGFLNDTQFPQYRWLPEGNQHVIAIEFGEASRKVLQASFKPLSEKGKITHDLLALHKKFTYEE